MGNGRLKFLTCMGWMTGRQTNEVKEHIKHIIQAFSDFNGGLIAWGEIGPDVPLENAEAMLWAFEKYGQHTLKV
jgi:uroporphyrinogen-III decarboxylase